MQTPETLLHIRTVPRGRDKERVLWGARYAGPPHVVFGHHAAPGLQMHPWATGLDTGCVYGGALTAVVLAADQRMPRPLPAARREVLVSQPARRGVFPTPGKSGKRVTAKAALHGSLVSLALVGALCGGVPRRIPDGTPGGRVSDLRF